jgi:hypothetical protein
MAEVDQQPQHPDPGPPPSYPYPPDGGPQGGGEEEGDYQQYNDEEGEDEMVDEPLVEPTQNLTPQDYHDQHFHSDQQYPMDPQQASFNNQNQNVLSQSNKDYMNDHSTFNIYVGNLNSQVDELDLSTTFAPCGEIVSTRVFREKNTGEHMVHLFSFFFFLYSNYIFN